jgi:hypothetical protein
MIWIFSQQQTQPKAAAGAKKANVHRIHVLEAGATMSISSKARPTSIGRTSHPSFIIKVCVYVYLCTNIQSVTAVVLIATQE